MLAEVIFNGQSHTPYKARVTVKDRAFDTPHTDSIKGWIGRIDTNGKVFTAWGLVAPFVALLSRKWVVVGSAEQASTVLVRTLDVVSDQIVLFGIRS